MGSSFDKEDLSIAYLIAVTAKIDAQINILKHDFDSKDVLITKQYKHCDVDIGVQLKSTNSKTMYRETKSEITYKLKSKNYNDLTQKSSTKKYLMLLILPENEKDWVSCKVDELILKKCMYWADFSSNTSTKNKNTINVNLLKNNRITPETLLQLMDKEAKKFL